MTADDRLKFVSVAASFKDEEGLRALGSEAVAVHCPACGAEGRRYGKRGEDFVLDGFRALSKGGLAGVHARCDRCHETVTLPL